MNAYARIEGRTGVDLVMLSPDAFADARDDVLPLLMRMAKTDAYWTEIAIVRNILSGLYQFWLVRASGSKRILGAWLTEVRDYPKGRTLIFQHCVGSEFRRWGWTRELIYDWARDDGCTRALAAMRRGFLRVIPEAREIMRVCEVVL